MALRGTLTHRKTRRLALAMGIPPCFALGVLESLWHVTGEQAPNGAIGRMTDQDIAMEMFYEGDPDKLISDLKIAGLVDVSDEHRLIVHDWHIHSDDATDNKLARAGQRYANGEIPRMRRLSKPERAHMAAQYRTPCESVRTESHEKPLPVPVPVPVPVPDPVPVPTTKTLVELSEIRPDDLEEVSLVERAFTYYCRKLGRDPQRYVLTPARKKTALTRLRERRRIRGSLEAAGDEFKQAIDNLAASDFHTNGGYTGWTENIFKSEDVFDKRLNWKQGGSNGNFKGKSGHSVDAATRAIQEIEDSCAADRVRDSQTGEAGHGGLQTLLCGSGTPGDDGPGGCAEGFVLEASR